MNMMKQTILFCLLTLFAVFTISSAEIETTDLPGTQPIPSEIEAVWKAFQSITCFETDFEELKTITFLEDPIKSSGKMYYRKPNLLVKDTMKPSRETLTITSGKMTLHSRALDVKETIDLDAQPSAQKVVNYMLQVFSGDRDSLSKSFRFSYRQTGPDGGMIIDLIPTDSALLQIMRRMQITTTPLYMPASLTLVEVDGDSTTTRFSKTQYNSNDLVIPGVESE